MKKLYTLTLLSISALALLSCAQRPNVKDPQLFRTKTGIIGVFRQPAFYCSEGNPHHVQLGQKTVEVKPTWSENQDNLFASEMPAGKAVLYSYAYSCNGVENKFTLDTAAEASLLGPIGVVIPEQGFCKAVISFVQGDKLFDKNDALIEEIAQENDVAVNMADIPYCEVFDNTGAPVTFVNRDSVIAAQYEAAIEDAADATAEEIYPLVVIDSASPTDKVTWNSDKSKVMMVTFNNTPDVYEDGRTIKLENEVWVMSERELFDWYRMNKSKVRNWNLRLNQLIGLPRNSHMTHFSVFWVDIKDLMRPAYVPDIASSDMKTLFEDDLDGNSDSNNSEMMMWFKNWFDDNLAKSYVKGGKGYPWTRLGYTYDWGARGSNKYGVSEFLIVPGAEVEVRFTKNIKSYLQWMDDRNN